MFLGSRTLSRVTHSVLLVCVLMYPGTSIFAQAATAPSFEVATIKPSDPNKPGGGIGFNDNKFTTNGQTVKVMMKFAYNLNIGTDSQISGGPNWVGTTKFDIVAKMDDDTIAALPKLPNDQKRERLQLMVQRTVGRQVQAQGASRDQRTPRICVDGWKKRIEADTVGGCASWSDAGPTVSSPNQLGTGYRCRVEDRWKGAVQLPICWPMCLDFSRRLGGEWWLIRRD